LACPICGDAKISVHSEAFFGSVTTPGKTLVFVCSESHTFLIPERSLRAARKNSRHQDRTESSIGELQSRADAAQSCLKSGSQRLGRLKAQLVELQAELRRTHAAMQVTHLRSRAILAECRESTQEGAKLSRLVEFGLHAPTRSAYELPIQ
jgi:septal ring factor EnvC (AmiA/AmiB activator)